MPTPSLTTQKEINLHLDKPNDLVYFQAKQYDALSRTIKINLFFNDAPWTLPGNIALSSTGSASAIYAMVRYLKPDGTKGMYDTDEENNQAVTGTSGNSYVIVRLAEQVLVVKGKVFTEISFYNADGQKLTSFGFIINVESSSISDEQYVSSDYYNLLRHDIATIYQVNEAFVSATQAAVSGVLTIDNTLSIAGAIADAKAAGDMIMVSNDQPSPASNILWIKKDDDEVLIPTMDDVNSAFKSGTDTYDTLYANFSGIITSTGVVSKIVAAQTYTTPFVKTSPGLKYFIARNDISNIQIAVIGYYDANFEFISRDIRPSEVESISSMVIPEGSAYFRISISMPNDCNPTYDQKIVFVSTHGIEHFENFYTLKNTVTKADMRLNDLLLESGRLQELLSEIEIPLIINSSNVWGYTHEPYTGQHICLKVNEGDHIVLSIKEAPGVGVYALLTEDYCFLGDEPRFAYKYSVSRNIETGEIVFTPIRDQYGDMIKDSRHVLSGLQTVEFYAVPNCKYLYISSKVMANGEMISILPEITINDHIYNPMPTVDENGNEYSTIFFDDFNGPLNTDVWSMITQTPPLEKDYYNSRFYTTDENAYTDQSCLVLKCFKGTSDQQGNGTHVEYGDLPDDPGHPNEYVAAYVSSGHFIAIPKGRITARIKFSEPGISTGFPSCFWTFGQNGPWSWAHEADIIEVIHKYTYEDRTTSSGDLIPAGSIETTLSSHLHTNNSNGDAVNTIKYLQIAYAKNLEDHYSDDVVYFSYDTDLDIMNWHEYAVEWNETQLITYIDGKVLRVFDAVAIDAVDENNNVGFFSPQDIRFNIKAAPTSTGTGYMFIDWVRVDSNNTPCTLIQHDDIEMSVGDTVYIKPIFNDDCSNHAYSMESSVDGIVSILNEYPRPTATIWHALYARQPGETVITMRSSNNHVTGTFTVTVT